jgi:hypothetical protein
MRRLVVAMALVALALSVVGHARQMSADPDKSASGGVQVPGWQARLDSASQRVSTLRFVPMGAGMHATTGPAAIFWKPDQTASGVYTVKATFTLSKLPEHQEAYGLFIGGSDLNGPTQTYTYFLIGEDGTYLIKKRSGERTSNVAGDWTAHAAVSKPDAAGKLSNELSIHVTRDKVTFMANGKEVASHPASAIDTSGIVGLRVNHNLDVHIGGFALQPGT